MSAPKKPAETSGGGVSGWFSRLWGSGGNTSTDSPSAPSLARTASNPVAHHTASPVPPAMASPTAAAAAAARGAAGNAASDSTNTHDAPAAGAAGPATMDPEVLEAKKLEAKRKVAATAQQLAATFARERSESMQHMPFAPASPV